MKAIQIASFGEPDVMKIAQIPDPVPGDNEVVVGIEAIGVNPVETYIRAGNYGPRSFPFTPGTDCAGTIAAVGAGAERFSVGDRVYTDGSLTGTYAEMALCKTTQVHPLPPNVDFEQGAAIGVPYTTALRGLEQRGKAEPGDTVLVHGATGGVGLAAVQLASARGMRVIATGGSDEGRKLAAECGASHVLNHHDKGYLDQIKTIAGEHGVDIVLEMLANINLANDLPLLAKEGRVVVIGSRGSVEIDPRQLMMRDAQIVGIGGANMSPSDREQLHAAIIAGLKNETLRPIISKRFALANAPEAHRAIMDSSGSAAGKIILTP